MQTTIEPYCAGSAVWTIGKSDSCFYPTQTPWSQLSAGATSCVRAPLFYLGIGSLITAALRKSLGDGGFDPNSYVILSSCRVPNHVKAPTLHHKQVYASAFARIPKTTDIYEPSPTATYACIYVRPLPWYATINNHTSLLFSLQKLRQVHRRRLENGQFTVKDCMGTWESSVSCEGCNRDVLILFVDVYPLRYATVKFIYILCQMLPQLDAFMKLYCDAHITARALAAFS